jgi:hypothetical protein
VYGFVVTALNVADVGDAKRVATSDAATNIAAKSMRASGAIATRARRHADEHRAGDEHPAEETA